jgi:hypothetical protein
MALEPTALLDILASKLAKISAMLAAQQRPLENKINNCINGIKDNGILKSERHNAQANSNVHICERMIEKTRALKNEKRKLH